MKKIVLIILLLIPLQQASAQWIDQSTQLFFPQKEGRMFDLYQRMPATWWNFFFYNKTKLSKDQACDKLIRLNPKDVIFSPCQSLAIQKEWLFSWAQQNTFHQPAPKNLKELQTKLNKALVRMSLPQNTVFLDVQRNFPLTDFTKVQKSIGEFYKIEPSDSDWEMIPILFSFSPQNIERTQKIKDSISFEGQEPLLKAIGPHFGSLDNKELIINDLKTVMNFGLLLLIALLSYLYITRKKLFFVLVPILFTAISFASFIIIISWGSIHGLTLAFGSGLIGISMDYAFHGWPERHRSKVWKSNSISFLTTFFAFSLLSFFSIPLVKQLSLFALVGLTTSFVLTYVISKKIPQKWRPQAAKIRPLNSAPIISAGFIATLIILIALSITNSRSDFSLSRMDSTQIENQEILRASSQQMNKDQLAFLMTPLESFKKLDSQFLWAKNNAIPFLGPTVLRGEQTLINTNLENWKNLICTDDFSSWKKTLSPQLSNLFSHFLNTISCENITGSNTSLSPGLFISKNHSLSIFRTSSQEQRNEILSQFPEVFFVSDITQNFPKKMKSEMTVFIIYVLLSVFLILSFFFRKLVFLTFIPVVGAMSFAFSAHVIIDIPLSFMSFISLIILLGLTLDFGIFSTSCFLWKKPLNMTFGSISLSAITSLAGFAPLAFCSHPVLRDLGITITTGILGAFLATYFIYPGLIKKFYGDNHA